MRSDEEKKSISLWGKARYLRLTKANLCVHCTRQKGPTRAKQVTCQPCENKAKALRSNWQKRNTKYYRDRNADAKRQVFSYYGGKCICCGETEPLFLSLDHINNDGAQHRQSILGNKRLAGSHTYHWVIRNGFPSSMQILCHNCNHGRFLNGGTCPRQEIQVKEVTHWRHLISRP